MKTTIERVRELKELKILEEELRAGISTIEDELKAIMTESGTEEMQVDIFKLRYKEVKSNRFDSAAFKQRYLDLYEQFSKPTVTRRFTVA